MAKRLDQSADECCRLRCRSRRARPSPTPKRSGRCSTRTTCSSSRLAGLVLLVAMIGAIVLTLRHRPGVKQAETFRREQVGAHARTAKASNSRTKRPGQGLGTMEITLFPLPDRRRHPLHHRRLRHLREPQERHHHPDVDRADAARRQHQPGRVLGVTCRTSKARSSR